MAGPDEARARSALAAMQDQLVRDPRAALGIAANATIEDIRAAFLELTKRYHPVRFGRMANDVQKLANEVFLSLRAAHDTLTKPLRRPAGPTGRAPVPSPPQPTPVVSPPSNGRATGPLAGRAVRPATANDTGERPVWQPARPSTANDTGERAAWQPTRPPSANDAAERQPPRTVAPTPSAGTKFPGSRAAPLPPVRPVVPLTGRPAGGGPAAAPRDEATVLDLLQRQQWDQARSALHQLTARDPSSKRLRALMCYARGREAQLDRRIDDARVELQDALDLDPDLQLAKTALTELFTRRK